MNTFPEATQGTSNNLRIIARGNFLAVLALVLVAVGGAALVAAQAPAWSIFALVAVGMAAYGTASILLER